MTERLYAHAKGDVWTTWLPLDEFKRTYPQLTPNYEQIRSECLDLETDFPTKAQNAQFADAIESKLTEKGVKWKTFFSGNKSLHTEADYPELASFDDKTREKAKEALAEHLLNPVLIQAIDHANFKTKRLVGIPGQPHRLTGHPKEVIRFYDSGKENNIPGVVFEKISQAPKTTFRPVRTANNKIKCLVCEHALTHRFPEGARNQVLAPNFMALNPSHAEVEQLAETQGMNIREITGWKACGSFQGNFNCKQLQDYVTDYNIWDDVCKKCGNRRVSDEYRITRLP